MDLEMHFIPRYLRGTMLVPVSFSTYIYVLIVSAHVIRVLFCGREKYSRFIELHF